jgi:hypothetical protein
LATKLNSEFNYRYQVQGLTIWEKVKTLKGFLEGRIRAAVLEEVGTKKYQSKVEKLEFLRRTKAEPYLILELEADILEQDSFIPAQDEAYRLNHEEIDMLERLLKEAYEIAELTRIEGYSDEQMFEANAANEFTTAIGLEIQAEIIANGRPSPAKIRNAMSNPITFEALQKVGLIPSDITLIGGSNDPLCIELKPI